MRLGRWSRGASMCPGGAGGQVLPGASYAGGSSAEVSPPVLSPVQCILEE